MVMDKVVLFAATLLLVFLSSSAWTAGDEMWKRTLSALDIPGATTTMGRPSIKGSGSLVSQNLMAAYVHNLTIDSGNNFGYIYDPVTDVQGQENFIGNTYDFAISDVALLPTQLAQCNREVMQIPFAINGAAAVYNLSGYKTGEIMLDAKTLAGIFQCEITYWNDTSIALLNNNTRLPAQLIYPVALYAPASATWLLTSYLTALAPGSWLGGPAKVLPWAPCVKRAGSTADVLSYLANTSYAIGVVQHLFADQQGLTYAAVQNKAGNFVLPNITSSYSDIAFPTSTKSHAWVDVSLSQSNDSSAYPLSGLEFCFVNQFDRHMGYPNGEMLKNLTFNLLDPLFQALLPHYGFSSVMPQILHLKSEQDIMTAETSPTDNTVDPVQTNPGDLHTNPPTNTGWRVQILEGTLIGAAAFLVLLGLAAGLVWRRKHAPQETITKEGRRNSSQALDKRLTGGSLQTVDELQFQYDASGCRICLGKGSYGAVYKARWKGTLVAVKVLTSHDEAQRQEFEREVALLELLRHSHIVNYLGHIFGANDQMMLITELMHGGDLGKRIHEEEGPDRKFGWYRAGASIALSIARGLTYLHSMNIVWFDCKPSNVLLDHSGYVAKIADVGLSRMLAGSGTDTVLRGTFDYMAPELFASYTNDDESQEVHHPITMAADIYSFGLVLWELIMKERPRRPSGTVRRLKPRVPKDCPQKIVDLYLKCLATDPKARPKAEVVMETIAASMVG